MATTRVALVQWSPTPGDSERNLIDALRLIADAAQQGAALIVLPELWDSGYGSELATEVRASAEPIDGPRVQALAASAREHGVWLCGGSMTEQVEDGVANTAVLFDHSGRLVATHRKAHLYTPGGEHRALVAGNSITTVATEEFGMLGLATCFDGDFPETARAMRDRGARIILHPSAYEVEAETWWDRLYPARALENGQWWLSCNQCGEQADFTMLGASRIISPLGHVVTEANRTVRGETPAPTIVTADIDFAADLAAWDTHCEVLVTGRRPALYDS